MQDIVGIAPSNNSRACSCYLFKTVNEKAYILDQSFEFRFITIAHTVRRRKPIEDRRKLYFWVNTSVSHNIRLNPIRLAATISRFVGH